MISRKEASFKNASTALYSQVAKMLGQFVVQTIFVHTLGAEYLGANGLFTNLITFLSFAELGIGAAFSYSFYQPLAENNKKKITAIINLYRKVYDFIGLTILIFGLILSAFVPSLVRHPDLLPHLRIYFILFLASSVVSYFFTYNRSLLIADQRGYIDSKNQLLFSILKYAFQIFFLVAFNSYFGFLVIQIVTNILSNLAITRLTYRQYPFLRQYKSEKVDKKLIVDLRKNLIGTVSSKIGYIIVTGTDNILISKYIGLLAVGIYSNYALVVNAIISVLSQVLNSVVASFGNLGVTDQKNVDKQLKIFNYFVYFNAISTFFIGLFLFGIFQPFIQIWLGKSYVLSDLTLIFIVVNFMFSQFRPTLSLVNAYGLFWGYRYKSIVEAVVNFGLSFALVKYTKMGINGVLLGTIIGNILVNSWWDPLILFSGAYKNKGLIKFYIKYWLYIALFLFLLFIEWLFIPKLSGWVTSIIDLIIYGISLAVIVGGSLLIILCRTSGGTFLKHFIQSKIEIWSKRN